MDLIRKDDDTSAGKRKWLRDVIIDEKKPEFDESLVRSKFSIPGRLEAGPLKNKNYHFQREVPGCNLEQLSLDYVEKLNVDQQKAVDRVISTQDYALLQGLPGTGKSSTICYIAKLLVARHQRVLITGYSNAAVDNMLMKLKEDEVGVGDGYGDVVRIASSTCHPNVQVSERSGTKCEANRNDSLFLAKKASETHQPASNFPHN